MERPARFIHLLLSMILAFCVQSQDIYAPLTPITVNLKQVNKTDIHRNKQGIWYSEKSDGYLEVCFYKDGKKDGICSTYLITGSSLQYFLYCIEFYQDGAFTGQSQYYHQNGMISMIQTEIGPNKDFLKEAQIIGYANSPNTIQCYCKCYSKEGKLESEGWFIYQDEFVFGEDVGIWKYYTPHGIEEVNASEILERAYAR